VCDVGFKIMRYVITYCLVLSMLRDGTGYRNMERW